MSRFLKLVSILLIFSLLFESCAVYRRDSVSLEEAAKTKKRVLMVRNNDKRVYLKKVQQIDGIYYGVTRVHGRKVNIQLDENDIKKLRPINRGLSTLGNAGFVLVGLIVITLIIFASDDWGDFNDVSFPEN